MTATYQLSLDELQPGFVDQLKQMHGRGNVKITVEVPEEHDETEFLLRNPKNRERLMEAIKNVEAGKVVEVDDECLDKTLSQLMEKEEAADRIDAERLRTAQAVAINEMQKFV